MSKWEQVGSCAVDSGQVVIADPCYLITDKERTGTDNDGRNYPYYDDLHNARDFNKDAQQLIFSDIAGIGVIATSGFGDGVYPVYVKKHNGRITEMKINFI